MSLNNELWQKDKAKTFVKDNVQHVSFFGEEFFQLGFDR